MAERQRMTTAEVVELLRAVDGADLVRESLGFDIQTLRSNVGDVHDTSGAEKVLARLNPSDLPYDDWFVDIVERMVRALNFIEHAFITGPDGAEPSAQTA
jgi:hypothetical protein